jgi:hypothetical protein
MVEQIQKGELKVQDLEDEVVECLLYNFLPGGNTILHKLAEQEEELILCL